MRTPVTINALKYDGSLHRSWSADLVEASEPLLVFEGTFDAEIDHPEMGVIRRGTLSTEFYWLDRNYNVFRFTEPEGGLKCIYCNVNLLPTFAEGVLNYVDLDIDILLLPGMEPRVLDLDEFDNNRRIYGYPDDVVETVRRSTEDLLRLVRSGDLPFSP